MRLDHLKVLIPYVEPFFNVEINHALSLLPTATAYSRNAIFSGLFPDEMVQKYPEQKYDMKNDSSSLNKYESQFFEEQLIRN